jgi:hypothetical protein
VNAEWVQPAVFTLVMGIIAWLGKMHIDSLKETIRNLTAQVAEMQKALYQTLSRTEADAIYDRMREQEVKCAARHGSGG